MLSYWEKSNFIHYQHIVIGSGIVGINVAIQLRKKYPTDSIVILERGILPTGASTKNAGFACMGSPTELLADLQNNTEEEVLQLFALRKKGLELTQQILGKDKMGYAQNGSYELLQNNELYAVDKIDYLNKLLQPITQTPAFTLANNKIKEFGFDNIQACIANNMEGEINTGLLMRILISYAQQQNIEIKTGCTVLGFEENKNSVHIIIDNPILQNTITLQARTLSICTNAFAKDLVPNIDLTPGRGQVLITKPIENLKIKGIFHFQEGYYYFREINNRILFGGGRNLDFTTETTTQFSINEKILADLQHKLQTILLPNTPHEIDYSWAGIMAFGNNSKKPIVKKHSDRIYLCVRMGGMGVAIGSEVARQMVELMER